MDKFKVGDLVRIKNAEPHRRQGTILLVDATGAALVDRSNYPPTWFAQSELERIDEPPRDTERAPTQPPLTFAAPPDEGIATLNELRQWVKDNHEDEKLTLEQELRMGTFANVWTPPHSSMPEPPVLTLAEFRERVTQTLMPLLPPGVTLTFDHTDKREEFVDAPSGIDGRVRVKANSTSRCGQRSLRRSGLCCRTRRGGKAGSRNHDRRQTQ